MARVAWSQAASAPPFHPRHYGNQWMLLNIDSLLVIAGFLSYKDLLALAHTGRTTRKAVRSLLHILISGVENCTVPSESSKEDWVRYWAWRAQESIQAGNQAEAGLFGKWCGQWRAAQHSEAQYTNLSCVHYPVNLAWEHAISSAWLVPFLKGWHVGLTMQLAFFSPDAAIQEKFTPSSTLARAGWTVSSVSSEQYVATHRRLTSPLPYILPDSSLNHMSRHGLIPQGTSLLSSTLHLLISSDKGLPLPPPGSSLTLTHLPTNSKRFNLSYFGSGVIFYNGRDSITVRMPEAEATNANQFGEVVATMTPRCYLNSDCSMEARSKFTGAPEFIAPFPPIEEGFVPGFLIDVICDSSPFDTSNTKSNHSIGLSFMAAVAAFAVEAIMADVRNYLEQIEGGYRQILREEFSREWNVAKQAEWDRVHSTELLEVRETTSRMDVYEQESLEFKHIEVNFDVLIIPAILKHCQSEHTDSRMLLWDDEVYERRQIMQRYSCFLKSLIQFVSLAEALRMVEEGEASDREGLLEEEGDAHHKYRLEWDTLRLDHQLYIWNAINRAMDVVTQEEEKSRDEIFWEWNWAHERMQEYHDREVQWARENGSPIPPKPARTHDADMPYHTFSKGRARTRQLEQLDQSNAPLALFDRDIISRLQMKYTGSKPDYSTMVQKERPHEEPTGVWRPQLEGPEHLPEPWWKRTNPSAEVSSALSSIKGRSSGKSPQLADRALVAPAQSKTPPPLFSAHDTSPLVRSHTLPAKSSAPLPPAQLPPAAVQQLLLKQQSLGLPPPDPAQFPAREPVSFAAPRRPIRGGPKAAASRPKRRRA